MFLVTYRQLVFIALGMAMMLLPAVTQAALIPSCDPVPGRATSCNVGDLIKLAVGVYNFLLGFAFIILLLMLVWGGFRMIYGSLTGNPEEGYKQGKETITQAIVGFMIVALAYVIVNTVLVFLGVDSGSAVGKLLQSFGLL